MKWSSVLLATTIMFSAMPDQASADHRHWHHDRGDVAGAVVGGLLLGGLALAASSHRDRDYYDDGPGYNPYGPPPPPYEIGGGVRPYGAPFSPGSDITCYPNQRACYNRHGHLMPSWTRKVF